MRTNRSMPHSTVIPVLAYPDVPAATDWLCAAFGFSVRLRIGAHRAQLNVGEGSVVAAQGEAPAAQAAASHSVMVRVEDVDAHHAQAAAHGATILQVPQDFPYGERQYTVEDLAGHRWTFSQSLSDVDPADWGGELLAD